MARILVIEDQDLVRATIKTVLERAGHSITVAADGLEGVQQFQHADFALVICDVFMPRKDGLATLKELQDIRRDVPVIVMSGGSMRPLRADDPATWTICGRRPSGARRRPLRNPSIRAS